MSIAIPQQMLTLFVLICSLFYFFLFVAYFLFFLFVAYFIGSCLKTGQHFIFLIIYLLLPINCIILDSVSKILFNFFLLPIIIIMILIMKILLHNEYKINNLTICGIQQFFNFPYNYKNRVLACFQTRPILLLFFFICSLFYFIFFICSLFYFF